MPQQSTPWYLYMLECEDGSIYTGIAVDVMRRYRAHASGKGAKYTRARPPRALLLAIRYPDRSIASRAEYEFKQLSAQQKRIWIAKGIALADVQEADSERSVSLTVPLLPDALRAAARCDALPWHRNVASMPLQGALAPAGANRIAGEQHAVRISCFTPVPHTIRRTQSASASTGQSG